MERFGCRGKIVVTRPKNHRQRPRLSCARDVVQALLRKQIDFAVDQQQWLQGYLPVVFLANYAKYGLLLQDDLALTGPSFVTPENAGRVVDLLTLGFR